MKKTLVLFLMTFLVFGFVFSTNIVLAESGSDDIACEESSDCEGKIDCEQPEDPLCFSTPYCSNNKCECIQGCEGGATNNDTDDDKDEKEEEDEHETKVEIEFEYFDEEGQKVRVREKTVTRDGKEFTEYKVRIKGVDVNSKLEIKQITRGNETKFRVRGRGDVEEALNYLPDDVAEIAREQLGSNDLNITLQEGRHKNLPRVLYQIETNKHGKFLGLFKLKMRVEGQVDPETGEFLGKSKPWWAFLVSGEDDDQTDDDDNDNNDNNETDTNQTNSTT